MAKRIKLPQIPKTGVKDPELRGVIDAVREILTTRAHGKERWLTPNDLVDLGLLDVTAGGEYVIPTTPAVPGSGGTGGGTGSGGTEGGGSGTAIPCQFPPTPTNVKGTAMFEGAFIDWDTLPTPYWHRHDYAEIFRASVDDRGLAHRVGTSPGTSYFDAVPTADYGKTFYYWVRFVNQCGDIGPFHGQRGVQVTIPYSPEYLLTLLTGQITSSQLYQELGETIERLDGSVHIPGSVKNLIAQVNTGSAEDYTAMNELLQSVYMQLQYQSAVVANVQILGTALAGQFNAYAATNEGITNTVANLQLASATSAINLTSLFTQTQQNSSYVSTLLKTTSEYAARVEELSARTEDQASTISAMQAVSAATAVNMQTLTTTVVNSQTTVTTLQYTTDSLAASTLSLTATMHAFDTGYHFRFRTSDTFPSGWTVTNGSLGISSFGSDGWGAVNASGLTPTVGTPLFFCAATYNKLRIALRRKITLPWLGVISFRGVANPNDWFSVNIPEPAWRPDNSAVIEVDFTNNINWQTRGTIGQLLFQLMGPWGTVGERAEEGFAFDWIAIGKEPTTSEIIKLEQAAKVWADPVHGMGGQYTVKIDAGGYVSGFGLASNPNDVVRSMFIVRADRFAIGPAAGPYWQPTMAYNVGDMVSYSPDGTLVRTYQCLVANTNYVPTDTGKWIQLDAMLPFIVATNNTVIDGVSIPPGVYIDGATIRKASIGEAMIKDLAVTNAKIANLSGDKILANTINAGAIIAGTITAREIAANSITADRIDTRNLTVKDANGNVILSASQDLHASRVASGGIFFQLYDKLGADAYPVSTYIKSAAITQALIAEAAIGSAQIDNVLQSTNYSNTPGNYAGWQINKSGNIILNELTARGTMRSNSFQSGVSGWEITSGGNAEFNTVLIRSTSNIESGALPNPHSTSVTVGNGQSVQIGHSAGHVPLVTCWKISGGGQSDTFAVVESVTDTTITVRCHLQSDDAGVKVQWYY